MRTDVDKAVARSVIALTHPNASVRLFRRPLLNDELESVAAQNNTPTIAKLHNRIFIVVIPLAV